MTTAIEQASNLFHDLINGTNSHFGAIYTSSDNYHDLEFYLGNTAEHRVSLFITIETDTLPGDGRSHFDGVCRLVGRPIGAMEDDEFSMDFGFDYAGIYTLTQQPRKTVSLLSFNEELFKEHFPELTNCFNESNCREVIQKLINRQKAYLSNIAHTAGVPLIWN